VQSGYKEVFGSIKQYRTVVEKGKELGCEKKTSYVIRSDIETVKNPLPGYD
jgi:hypothetical protein